MAMRHLLAIDGHHLWLTVFLLCRFRLLSSSLFLDTGFHFLLGLFLFLVIQLDISNHLLLLRHGYVIDDGDTHSSPNELGQVNVKGMMGKHGKALTLRLVMRFSKGNAKDIGCLPGIFVQRLVEVSLTEQQQGIRMLLLQRIVLFCH